MKTLPQLLLSAAVLVTVSSLQAEQVTQSTPAPATTQQEQIFGYLGTIPAKATFLIISDIYTLPPLNRQIIFWQSTGLVCF